MRDLLREDVVAAARALLGWTLHRGSLAAQIVETEAYRYDEAACHAYGKTKMKNMALFGPPGRAYIYFTYGCHWMLNISALEEGSAAAVLIRAAMPLSGQETMASRRPKAVRETDLLSGPGKLAAAFGIDARQNELDLLEPNEDLFFAPGDAATDILVGPRVGIAIGKAHDYPWRFIDRGLLKWASKPWPRSGP